MHNVQPDFRLYQGLCDHASTCFPSPREALVIRACLQFKNAMLLQQCSLRQASTPFQKSEVSCQRSADVLRIEARGDVSLMCVGGGELHGLLLQRPDYSASVLMAGQRALVLVYGRLKHLNDSTPFGK